MFVVLRPRFFCDKVRSSTPVPNRSKLCFTLDCRVCVGARDARQLFFHQNWFWSHNWEGLYKEQLRWHWLGAKWWRHTFMNYVVWCKICTFRYLIKSFSLIAYLPRYSCGNWQSLQSFFEETLWKSHYKQSHSYWYSYYIPVYHFGLTMCVEFECHCSYNSGQ